MTFDDIWHAFTYVSAGQPCENNAYVCRATGAIHYHSEFGDNEEPLPDDVSDEEKYVAVPHKNDLDLGARLVFDFVDEALPDDAAEVREIFRRAGAYRRFKGFLGHRGALEQWHRFEDRKTEEVLRAWCAENGLELRDE